MEKRNYEKEFMINEILSEIVSDPHFSFFVDNIDYYLDLILALSETDDNFCNKKLYEFEIDFNDGLNLIREYLESLGISEEFDKRMSDGSINIIYDDEYEMVDRSYDDDEYEKYCSKSGNATWNNFDNKYSINVYRNGKSSFFFIMMLLHEFFHTYNDNILYNVFNDESFSEIQSIYYENDFFNWLVCEKNYPSDVADSYKMWRLQDCKCNWMKTLFLTLLLKNVKDSKNNFDYDVAMPISGNIDSITYDDLVISFSEESSEESSEKSSDDLNINIDRYKRIFGDEFTDEQLRIMIDDIEKIETGFEKVDSDCDSKKVNIIYDDNVKEQYFGFLDGFDTLEDLSKNIYDRLICSQFYILATYVGWSLPPEDGLERMKLYSKAIKDNLHIPSDELFKILTDSPTLAGSSKVLERKI